MRNGRNETTTAGNYLILLPPSPPRIVSVRAGARLISPSGIWKFPPPPGPAPLHQDSSVSAQVRHTRIKHMRSVCTRCVIEKEPSIFYHPPPPPLSTRNETTDVVALASRCSLPPFSRKGCRIRVFARVASRPAFDYVYSRIYRYVYISSPMSCESSQIGRVIAAI